MCFPLLHNNHNDDCTYYNPDLIAWPRTHFDICPQVLWSLLTGRATRLRLETPLWWMPSKHSTLALPSPTLRILNLLVLTLNKLSSRMRCVQIIYFTLALINLTVSGGGAKSKKVDLLRYVWKIDLEKIDFLYFFDLYFCFFSGWNIQVRAK